MSMGPTALEILLGFECRKCTRDIQSCQKAFSVLLGQKNLAYLELFLEGPIRLYLLSP